MNMHKSADLEVFIPTHNRQTRLIRLLDYLRACSRLSGVRVTIVDSSDFPINKKTLNRYQELNYVYRYGYSLIEKFKLIRNLICSPYFLLLADDDQPAIYSMLNAFQQVKKSSSNFSSLVGLTLDYNISRFNGYRFHKPYSHYYYAFSCQENTEEKLHNILTYYTQSVWAVHRTDLFADFADIVSDFATPPTMLERALPIYMQIRGDIVFSQKLFLFRDRSLGHSAKIVPFDVAYEAQEFRRNIEHIIQKLDSIEPGVSVTSEILRRHFNTKRRMQKKSAPVVYVRVLQKATRYEPVKKAIEWLFKNRRFNITTSVTEAEKVTLSFGKLLPIEDSDFQRDMDLHRTFVMLHPEFCNSNA